MDQIEAKRRLLISIYFDPSHPSSFSSIRKLYLSAKAINSNITLEDVKRFLQNVKIYTSYKPVQTNFKRRKIIVRGMNDQWQLDLIVLPRLKLDNAGYTNILAVIDCFSRYAYVEPMKTKLASETLSAFENILKRAKVKPRNIQTDLGSEFKGIFARFLKEHNIHQFSTSQDTKCAIVERFIRTFKGKLFKYMKAKKTRKYADILQVIVNSYNHTRHRSLGISPIEVNKGNEQYLWEKQYRDYLFTKQRYFKFKVGDKVRLTKYRKEFHRGFYSNWRSEVFQVAHILNTDPPTYILQDKQELLRGAAYAKELAKVLGFD